MDEDLKKKIDGLSQDELASYYILTKSAQRLIDVAAISLIFISLVLFNFFMFVFSSFIIAILSSISVAVGNAGRYARSRIDK